MSGTGRSGEDHVRRYLDIPLSRLNRYAAIRSIDVDHVEALQESLAGPEDLRSNPLEVYEYGDGYVVQDGTHRVSAIRAYYSRPENAEDDPKIPCLIVETPATVHDAVVAATAANMRREVSKATSFAEKVVAISGLAEGFCLAAEEKKPLAEVSWRDVKAFYGKGKLASLPFAEKRESSNTFAVARGVKPFLDGELVDAAASVDSRSYELYLAVSSQPLLLDSVAKRQMRPMFETLPAPGQTSPQGQLPITTNLSLSYFQLHVPVITGLGDDIRPPLSSLGFTRLIYLISLLRVLGVEDGADATSNRSKRRKTSKPSVRTFTKSGSKGAGPSSSDKLSTAVVALVVTFDHFAQSLRRKSIEDMIMPYLFFDQSAFTLRPLRTSGDQRSISSLHRSYSLYQTKVITAPASSPCPSGVERDIWERPNLEDSQLRLVAQTFLRELESVVIDENLYDTSGSDASRWRQPKSEPFEKFHLGGDDAGLPRQIESLRSNVLSLQLGAGVNLEAGSSRSPHGASSQSRLDAAEVQAGISRTERASRAIPASSSRMERTRGSTSARQNTSTASPGPVQPRGGSRSERTPREAETRAPLVTTVPQSQGDPEEAIQRLTGGKWRMERCSFAEFAAGEGVQLVLTDPPYGVRAARSSGPGGAYYDRLSPEDIRHASEVISSALRPGGHAVIFCSYQQAGAWEASLANEKLAVDPLPIIFVRSPGYYSQSCSQASTQLRNAWEMAVHAVKPATQDVAMTAVNYGPLAPVPPGTFTRSRHAGWMNIIENVERPSDGETLIEPSTMPARGRGRMVRPEQKSVKLMQELIARFSQPQDLVLDLFAGTFSTAVACLQMPAGQFRRFAGCEIDRHAFPMANRRVLTKLSELVLAGELMGAEIPGKRSLLVSACREYLSGHRRGRVLSRPSASSRTPYDHGLPGHSPLPHHLLLFIASSFREPDVLKWDNIGPDRWPRRELAFRLQEVADELLACDAASQGLFVAASTIPQAGDGVFAARSFAKDAVITWYGGTVVYEDLGRWTQANRECGPVGFGVTRSHFATRGLSLSHAHPPGSDEMRDLQMSGVWVVASPFCVGGKVNDPRTMSAADNSSSREANAEFIDDRLTEELEAIAKNPFHARLVALRDIAVGEEIFVDYGPDFDLSC